MKYLEQTEKEVNNLKVGDFYPFPSFKTYREYLAIDMAIKNLPNKKYKYHDSKLDIFLTL